MTWHHLCKYVTTITATTTTAMQLNIFSHKATDEKIMVTLSSRWARWSRLRDPMITAHSRLGEVTAQSRQGHSSVTARSQLSHGEITAKSQHLQYDHGSVTAMSQLNHGPGHSSVTTGCDHFGNGELTVSSWWAQGEPSRWPIFSHGKWHWYIFTQISVILRGHTFQMYTYR